ncbi:MaoC/PaaZ C-terminal domain-containing protein [Aquisalimonas sp.]|uniref:MaoC/PaaZ C-terminal domain-containing protein n=1 Tax=unclassified Aquisalimonas TaxID=2644645 RepID=UPI0025C339FD|nr:MaoC/PaaZ C-terminal domain-containing protein [Aquisalimonas sp.]
MHAAELQSVHEERVFTQVDFKRFGDISGDRNPIHVDPAFSAETAFGATVAHGMLLFSAVHGLVARSWPGARLLQQDLMFPAPTYADEPVIIALEPLWQEDGCCWRVATRVEKADGRRGLDGQCLVGFGGEEQS